LLKANLHLLEKKMNTAQQTNHVFSAAFKLMIERLPGARIDEADGMDTRFANVPLPFLNFSFYERPIADLNALRQVVQRVVENARTCSHPWFHALCEDLSPPNWVSVAAEFSLAPAMRLTGMFADRLTPATRSLPPLEWRKVQDDNTARDLAVVNAHAYAMPPELFDCLFNTHIWKPDTYASVGYLDGQPVTCSAALPVEDTMYVALVATLPGHRAKGYAEASMRHTIQQASVIMGNVPLTLHASDAGRPLYSAMGFMPCATFSLLTPAHA
jgi:GNAT superfamily N-acetyltransferase